jgi:hypothetical protein
MKITRIGTQASAKGPANWFTGTVRLDPVVPSTGTDTRTRRACHLRTWRSYRVAYVSTRADPDRDIWLRMGTAGRRTDRRNTSGGCVLVLS